LRDLFFRDGDGQPTQTLSTGEPISLCATCEAHDSYSGVGLDIRIVKVGGIESAGNILSLRGQNDNAFSQLSPGLSEIRLQMPYLGLVPGVYSAQIRLRKDAVYTFDVVESFRFTVTSQQNVSKCQFYQPRSWSTVPVIAPVSVSQPLP
jgi:lipopolysaccharide transport system ATP-binding protein